MGRPRRATYECDAKTCFSMQVAIEMASRPSAHLVFGCLLFSFFVPNAFASRFLPSFALGCAIFIVAQFCPLWPRRRRTPHSVMDKLWSISGFFASTPSWLCTRDVVFNSRGLQRLPLMTCLFAIRSSCLHGTHALVCCALRRPSPAMGACCGRESNGDDAFEAFDSSLVEWKDGAKYLEAPQSPQRIEPPATPSAYFYGENSPYNSPLQLTQQARIKARQARLAAGLHTNGEVENRTPRPPQYPQKVYLGARCVMGFVHQG